MIEAVTEGEVERKVEEELSAAAAGAGAAGTGAGAGTGVKDRGFLILL